ncbi:hypothetical protein HDU67_008763 [Dinochytrium kinnereticum]|nr:hypothetical protein HDU67_008763 [Dinochytrium kinnereticum]
MGWSKITITTVATVAILVNTLLNPVKRSRQRNETIPGPWAWPIIGNLVLILSMSRNNQGHKLRDYLHKRYGSIVKVKLMNREAILVADPAAAKKVLCSDEFKKTGNALGYLLDRFKYLLFLMPTDPTWRRHRKLLVKGFGPSHQRETLEVTNNICDQLLKMWDSHGSGYITNIHHAASCLTIDVIGVVAFSYAFNAILTHEQPNASGLVEDYNHLLTLVATRPFVPKFLWSHYGVDLHDKLEETRSVKAAVLKAVLAKREVMKENGFKPDGSRRDVLDWILESSDWTDDEITDEVLALFLAGSETSANSIVFCIYLLDQYPHTRTKLEKEVDNLLTDSPDGKISWDQLSKLTYMDCFIKETLRLHPVIPFTNSRTNPSTDVELAGHIVNAGSSVVVDIRQLHRNEAVWKRPEEFDPDRWEGGFSPTSGAFMPFGDGMHSCLGMKMAMVEIKAVLARLIARYRMEVVRDQDLIPVTTIAHGFKNGLLVRLEKRHL